MTWKRAAEDIAASNAITRRLRYGRSMPQTGAARAGEVVPMPTRSVNGDTPTGLTVTDRDEVRLRKLLVERMELDDLKTMAFDLGCDDLRGTTQGGWRGACWTTCGRGGYGRSFEMVGRQTDPTSRAEFDERATHYAGGGSDCGFGIALCRERLGLGPTTVRVIVLSHAWRRAWGSGLHARVAQLGRLLSRLPCLRRRPSAWRSRRS